MLTLAILVAISTVGSCVGLGMAEVYARARIAASVGQPYSHVIIRDGGQFYSAYCIMGRNQTGNTVDHETGSRIEVVLLFAHDPSELHTSKTH